MELSRLPAGIAFSFSPPAIPGVGSSGGFTFVLEDRAGNDVQFLAKNLGTFLEAARKRAEIAGDRKSTRLNSSHGYISYAVFCLKKKKLHIQLIMHIIVYTFSLALL